MTEPAADAADVAQHVTITGTSEPPGADGDRPVRRTARPLAGSALLTTTALLAAFDPKLPPFKGD